MTKLDPRINAFRDDLAANYLQDIVRAPRYVAGEPRQIAAPAAAVRATPKFDAPVTTEALMGEMVTLYDVRDGWGWVQLQDDRYVGYMTLDGLSALVEPCTHRVSARLTYLYPAPDMKRPPITKLSFSTAVTLMGRPEGRFFELSRGGYIFADHLVGIRERAKDYVRVAERFVGAPYLWGGKTTLGIDCSALVQISMNAAGASCPRDSDMQASGAGEAIDPKHLDTVQRGDLLFWQGHVAIAQSGDWLLHASGHHMEVVVEPIRRAIERIGESHGPLLVIRRPVIDAPAEKLAAASAGAMPNTTAPRIAAQPEKVAPNPAAPNPPAPATPQAGPTGAAVASSPGSLPKAPTAASPATSQPPSSPSSSKPTRQPSR